ncbi:putative sulfate exporter family transporter [Ferrovibrio sp.]|uniref:YeiH family protein n=1 Tax=Ferrovibrio sp. TaxID=1917215 RepID=UPI000CBD682B|nr:putative sulfate exporter family transporter [Ferrovibrio sp.]PJI39148.1 MAG: putative sulfate exporter family transporter [Ferrovibrio sp.]
MERVRNLLPGLTVAATVALAVGFIADHYGGPQFLLALLLGMAFNFLSTDARVRPGIDLSARTVLRIGVALLGIRITMDRITELGPVPILLAVCGVTVAISTGLLLARLAGRSREEGLLSGGAVGICGASAAMAISAALPRSPQAERLTLLTVIGVTAFSTIAMIIYPVLAKILGLDETASGVLFGATIHDVAQVLGAGLTVSPHAGDVATFVKLVRVACLLPVVVGIGLIYRTRAASAGTQTQPLLPHFLLGFIALVVLGSVIPLPAIVVSSVSEVSRWCLLIAISALGVKTSFAELFALGWKPLALILTETLVLLCFVLAGLFLFF